MSLNFQNGTVTVGTTAALAVSLNPAQWAVLQNTGANTVYIGGPTVTSSGAGLGVSIAAGASLAIPASGIDVQNLYAITSTLTSALVWLTPGN
jgi:hypothetical protein